MQPPAAPIVSAGRRLVIEVGANIGSHTVGLAQSGPQADGCWLLNSRLVFQTLCANVALNSLTQVDCCGQASAPKRVISLCPSDPNEDSGGVSLLDGMEGRHVYPA